MTAATMIQVHKIALDVNNVQQTHLKQAAGVARFAYNWALGEWRRQYKAALVDDTLPKPNAYQLRKQLNAIKRDEFPWMMEVTKYAPQQAIINLGAAFERFFNGVAKYPTFKKKGVHDSFTVGNDQVKLKGSMIRLPRIGWVKLREDPRFSGRLKTITLSRRAQRWYVSLGIEVPLSVPTENPIESQDQIVGVDLGLKDLAIFDDGKRVPGAKPLKTMLRKKQRLNRSLSRKKKGSMNRRKAREKLTRIEAKIAFIRQDGLHKLTTKLVNEFDVIAIEDLSVQQMQQIKYHARNIADMGWYEFRRQLTYKTEQAGKTLYVADRYFPSSKTCSSCGHVMPSMPLNIRNWTCPQCNAHHDRDVNAAINLKNSAIEELGLLKSDLAVSNTDRKNACGEKGAAVDVTSACNRSRQTSGLKQEVITDLHE